MRVGPIGLFVFFVAAVAFGGCGRTELFSSRKCPPTEPACQINVGDGGIGAHLGPDGAREPGGSADGKGGDGQSSCAAMREICNNGKDDNCNNLSDCADPACFGDPACSKPGQEICNNGIDDNGDGLVDCADPECKGSLACRPAMGQEICDNGKDDNGDGLVDCADPQCTAFPACLNINCAADQDLGALPSHGGTLTATVDTTGAARGYTTCATPGGRGRVLRFSLAAPADVKLDFTQAAGGAHVVSLFRAGASQACDRNPITCVAVGEAPAASHTFPALAVGVYWLIVESFLGTEGKSEVSLSTGKLGTPEICDNGIDDDGNGLIDCQDLACANAPNCASVECKPDTLLGALVIDAAPKVVQVDLTRAPSRYKPTCAGAMTDGGDAALAFVLPEAGGVEIAYTQTGQSIFSLFRQPDPGFACDDAQVGCSFEDQRSSAVAFSELAAGRYLLIFKATSNAQRGVLNLRISAFRNRRVEICDNGIDDDGNGLIDCADPACFGIGTCAAPACAPDVDLGMFSWGTADMTTVNTTGGRSLYQTSCSKGNGKERVVRFSLTQPMALGVDCMDSGSHVLQLSQQLAPLDACNAHPIGCADPQALPFGCGYAIPDLQPGVYNLIIQAFQANTEGTVSLSLTGIREVIREICDNGIDDDHDGATDCADLKCVTSPICEKFACRPAKTLGLLPLDGSLMSMVIQTTGAGDNETKTACVSVPGGQDGDVDFQLPAKANLTLEWAQVGNHDFALYSDGGVLLSCEAGTSFACVASGGQPTGTKIMNALPAGRYHLIIDADKPGAEGGVAIQLSAVAAP